MQDETTLLKHTSWYLQAQKQIIFTKHNNQIMGKKIMILVAIKQQLQTSATAAFD